MGNDAASHPPTDRRDDPGDEVVDAREDLDRDDPRFGRDARGTKRISPFSMKYAVSATVSATFTDCSTRITVTPLAAISRTMA